jgi:hypothetical protein
MSGHYDELGDGGRKPRSSNLAAARVAFSTCSMSDAFSLVLFCLLLSSAAPAERSTSTGGGVAPLGLISSTGRIAV